MEDVSQARVRVLPSRFKKLKKIIANCDRRIQVCNTEISRAKINGVRRNGQFWDEFLCEAIRKEIGSRKSMK